jgi:hypothetical protein
MERQSPIHRERIQTRRAASFVTDMQTELYRVTLLSASLVETTCESALAGEEVRYHLREEGKPEPLCTNRNQARAIDLK